ncbi:MAG: phage holin family protein [Myxococcaceae bacterium]|nr:phage holin family protein [Myxococcaceae bacterium]
MNVIEHAEQVSQGLAKLLGLHLKLARLELSRDAKTLAMQAGAALPLLLVGLTSYVLLTAAVVLFFTRFLPVDLALALVGGLNALGGALGLGWARSVGQRRTEPTAEARAEVVRSLMGGVPPSRSVSTSHAEPIHG